MMKKMLGVFTSIVAALAVVGVAWASGDDGASTSVTSAGASTSSSAAMDTSVDDSSPATGVTAPEATTPSTAATNATSTSLDDGSSSPSSSSTSTSIAAGTSTSAGGGSTTSTSLGSSTSTSLDDSDGSNVADQVTTHSIPGVGTVTIEVFQGVLYLSGVSAPGWDVVRDKMESDRIELEFTSGESEAEFEARLRAGGVDVKIEVDTD